MHWENRRWLTHVTILKPLLNCHVKFTSFFNIYRIYLLAHKWHQFCDIMTTVFRQIYPFKQPCGPESTCFKSLIITIILREHHTWIVFWRRGIPKTCAAPTVLWGTRVKLQLLIRKVWGEAWDPTFLTCSLLMPMQLVHIPTLSRSKAINHLPEA